jgi:hypothetical protein
MQLFQTLIKNPNRSGWDFSIGRHSSPTAHGKLVVRGKE